MPMTLSPRWMIVSLMATCALSACERREARAEDPYAARMAQPRAPYDRAAAPRVAQAGIAADSAPAPFTLEQAARGQQVYASVCARCHATTQWQGGTFAAAWQGRRLSDFHDLVATTMPQDNPGGLSPQQYVDVTAYILQLGGVSPGAVPLTADTAVTRHVRLAIKSPVDTTAKR